MEFGITSSEISRILTSFRSEGHPLQVLRFCVWGKDPIPRIFDYRTGEIDSALDKLHELSLVYFVPHVGFLGDVIDGADGVILVFEKSKDGETNVDCGVFESVCDALTPLTTTMGLALPTPLKKQWACFATPLTSDHQI